MGYVCGNPRTRAVGAALLCFSNFAMSGVSSISANAQQAPAARQDSSQLPPLQVDAPTQAQRKKTHASRNPAATTRRAASERNPERKPVVPVADRPGGFNSTAQLGPPPPAYAGGQVATGGKVGLLGNKSVFDTPYSFTSFTAQQIQNTQANSLVDLAISNPSVRATSSRGSFFDILLIRGFATVTGDFLFDGIAGVLPDQTFSAAFADRIEVLQGPALFLSGIALEIGRAHV